MLDFVKSIITLSHNGKYEAFATYACTILIEIHAVDVTNLHIKRILIFMM